MEKRRIQRFEEYKPHHQQAEQEVITKSEQEVCDSIRNDIEELMNKARALGYSDEEINTMFNNAAHNLYLL